MSTFLPELTRSFLNPVFLMFGNPNSVFIKIRKKPRPVTYALLILFSSRKS